MDTASLTGDNDNDMWKLTPAKPWGEQDEDTSKQWDTLFQMQQTVLKVSRNLKSICRLLITGSLPCKKATAEIARMKAGVDDLRKELRQSLIWAADQVEKGETYLIEMREKLTTEEGNLNEAKDELDLMTSLLSPTSIVQPRPSPHQRLNEVTKALDEMFFNYNSRVERLHAIRRKLKDFATLESCLAELGVMLDGLLPPTQPARRAEDSIVLRSHMA